MIRFKIPLLLLIVALPALAPEVPIVETEPAEVSDSPRIYDESV